MSIVIPNTLEVSVLEYILKTANLVLRLYSNNYIPNEASVVGSFTEVVGGGYAAKTLTAASWTITSGDPTVGEYAVQTFSFTGTIGGSGVVYGYYVTNVAGTVLYWAEALPGTISPFTPANGAYVKVVPIFNAS